MGGAAVAWGVPVEDVMAHPACLSSRHCSLLPACLHSLCPASARCWDPPALSPGVGPALTHPAAKEELENLLPAVPVHEGVVLEHRGGGGLLTVGLRGLLGKVVGPVVFV